MAKVAKKAKPETMTVERQYVVAMFQAMGVKGVAKETNDFLTEKVASLPDELDEDTINELEEENEDAHGTLSAMLKQLNDGGDVEVVDDDEDEEEVEAEDTEDEESEDDDGEESDSGDDEESSEDEESDEESDDSEDDDAEDEDEEDEEVETPQPKKAATKAAAKPAAKKPAPAPAKKGGKAAPAKVEKPAPKKVEKKPKGPGVISTIIGMLAKASKKNPVTKAQMHAVLVKTFKEREAKSMLATLNAQVPTGLRNEKDIIVKSVAVGDTTGYYVAEWSDKCPRPKV